MAERIIPESIDINLAVASLARRWQVTGAVTTEPFPLRRKSRKCYLARVSFTGERSGEALDDLDNWLEAQGVF